MAKKGKKLRIPDIRVEVVADPQRLNYHTRMLLANGQTMPIYKDTDLSDPEVIPNLTKAGRELAGRLVSLYGMEAVVILNYTMQVVRAELFDWHQDKIHRDTLAALTQMVRMGRDRKVRIDYIGGNFTIDGTEAGDQPNTAPSKKLSKKRTRRQRQHISPSETPPTPNSEPEPDST